MRRTPALLLVVSLLGVSAPVFAQGASERTTRYDFVDEPVLGEGLDAPKEVLVVRRPGERASLIDIRSHFVPEMLKTVEEL